MPEGTVHQIGRYKIVGELGRGGFGRVYRGFDASVGRQVAIKVLTEGGRELLARFRNEAQVAGNLRHENIVTVYEYGEHEGQPFLAMEYLEGEDLHQIISSGKHLSLLEKCEIMSQAAEGLHCAHSNGVVHRDVKPANIMVRPDGRVKIMDFGIARITQDRDATRLTREGWLVGTLLYMAPEQFAGGEIDALCDIFAFGAVYYELLTGRHPFQAPDSRSLMYKISFEDPPPVRDLLPDCPEVLERVVMRLLHKDRELRYQSLKDVQFDTDIVRIELKKQRAEDLLGEAQTLVQESQLDAAQSILVQALGLDPSNTVARTLRESLRKRLQHRALQPRIDALMTSGEDCLARRDYSEAVQRFEGAFRLDDENPAIRARLDHARTLLEHSKKAGVLIATARREFDNHNLTAAYQTVSEALRHDSGNPTAAELLARIQSEIERRQREQRIEEALHRAEGLVLLHSYTEAIDLLAGLGPEANAPKVEQLLTWLKTEKVERERKEKLAGEMAAATDLLRRRNLSEAVNRLEALRRDFPDEKEVSELLSYTRKELEAESRASAIKELASKASAFADSKDFNAGLTLLESALKQYPGEPTLIRMLGSTMAAKAAWERQEAIGNTLRRCTELREQQRFAEAIQLVEATLRDYSADSELLAFREELEHDWARKRRDDAVAKAANHAAGLLDRKQPLEAQQYLRQALIQYPGEGRLTDLLKLADVDVRSVEKARTIDAIAADASARASTKDFGRALAAIDQGLQTWDAEPRLLDLRKEIAAALAAWERQKDIEDCIQRANALVSSLKFREALELVEAKAAKYSGETQLAGLRTRIEQDWERHKQREAIQSIAAEIRLLLSRGRLDEAAETARDGLRQHPRDADLEALSAQVRDAIQARDRAHAIEGLVRESRDLAAADKFGDAQRILEKALSLYPAEKALLLEMESARAAEEKWQREQTIAATIAEAGRLAGELRFEDALELLGRSAPLSRELVEARTQIERERDEHKRREAVSKGAADAAALLQSGRPEAALKLLEQLTARYPGEPQLDSLAAQAREALEQRRAIEERRRAVEQVVRECDEMARQSRFEDALQRVAASLREYGEEPALVQLQERLTRSKEDRRRADAIGRALATAASMIETGRLEEAIESLRQSLAQYPGEAALGSLLARTEAGLAARKEHERVLAECRDLLEQHRLEDAVRAVERAMTQFPGDAELISLAARARGELEQRRREEQARREAEHRKQRQSDLEQLRALQPAIAQTVELPRLSELGDAAHRIAAGYPEDEEVRSAAADVSTHLSDIETAKGALLKGNFGAALNIAEGYLARFPEHATFQVVRRDAGTLRRSAELDDFRRRADAEPDLSNRAKILENALARYPDEMSLAAALQTTRQKLSVVEAIVAEARAHEAAGAWGQALERWNKLATVYDRFPGLSAEIERVRTARGRADAEAVARWAGQIEPLIESGNSAAAGQLLERALAEFPKAAALQELQRKLDEIRARERRATALLDGMRASREARNWDQLGRQVVEAMALTAAIARLRMVVLESLLESAQAVVNEDWHRAEEWTDLARKAQPACPVPDALARAIAEKKRAAAIEAAFEGARELELAGNRREALAHLDAALREFADEERLLALRRAIEEELQQQRANILAELNEIRAACERATGPAQLALLESRAAAVGSEARQDPDLAPAAAETVRAIALRRKQLTRDRVIRVLRSKSMYIAAATAAVVIAGIVTIPRLLTVRRVSVAVTSETAGASVVVGSAHCVTPKCTLELRPGTYTLTATKDGFRTLSQSLTISGTERQMTVPLVFDTLPEELQVNTNFESGSVYLDDRPARPLRDGQFSVSGLLPGQHRIRITGGDAEFHVEWASAPGTPPRLLGPISANNLRAAVVANAGGNGVFACNCQSGAVLVDGSPAGRIGPDSSVHLAQLRPGPRQIAVEGQSVVLNVRPNPAMNIFLALDRNTGTLVINAGVDNAKVYLNDRLYPRRTEHGVLRIPLDVGQYSIRVEKDNFRTPAAATAGVAKGVEQQVTFTLAPLPPVLEITGAEPEAHVKVDGRPAGETDRNGHLRAEVPAGRHTVELSKDGYKPARLDLTFVAGQDPIRLGPAQVTMAKLTAPPTPQPKPADSEAQDWARVSNSGRVQDLQEYIRKHPGGPHERDAQSKMEQLQQAEAAAAEQAAWDSIDKNSRAALQAFVARYGGGTHAAEARNLLEAMEKREAADAANAERKKAEQEQSAKAADAQAVLKTLGDYEAAFNRMDLPAMERVYNPMPAALRDQFRDFKSVSFQIKPTGAPAVNGDSATVTCTRTQSVTVKQGGHFSSKPERVRVTLSRLSGRWVIREIVSF